MRSKYKLGQEVKPLSTNPPRTEATAEETSARAKPAWRLADGAARAVRQFFEFCAAHPGWAACMTVFILVWTIELYLVQAHTLVFPNEPGPRYALWAPKIRFALDLLFISMLTVVVRRRWLIVILFGSFFAYLGLLTYFKYFFKPLSYLTMSTNWREGLHLSGFATDMVPRGAALMLLGALAIKLAALVLSRKVTLPRASAWVVGGLLFVNYAGLYAVSIHFDPLTAILTTRGVGRLGHIRGYLGPWFAEWYYLADEEILRKAVALRSQVYDRISPLEADIPIHPKFAIIQAESLDTNILGYKVDGVEVTPFLNALRKESMFFRVQAAHLLASSEADFATLNAVPGSVDENTYAIPGYPYENTTPQILSEAGFETYFYHGFTGEFYVRRAAFEKMGFAGLRFQEELEDDYGLSAGRFGIFDADVLGASARDFRHVRKPACHFIITLTTHTPYLQLPAPQWEVYQHPTTSGEHYINNMRYLDKCLRDYITSLGDDTTLVIYSDHPTEPLDGFDCDRHANGQFIPCLIYDSEQDLSKVQKTRDDPRSTDGTWSLLDVVNYLRTQIKRSAQAGAKPEDARAEKGPPDVREARQ
jgi:phosphoglycerol transferase MdoB-like AlkP superfamily enzyme